MDTILDLDAYPMDRPDSPECRDLLARCRQDLAAHGMFNLGSFAVGGENLR